MVHYKLSYFNSRGKAEIARQLFAVAGVAFEDERIPKDQFVERKVGESPFPRTLQGFPFGQLPVLEVDGVQLAQSASIVRYLARQFGLAGKTLYEEALVDSLAEQFKDFIDEIRPFAIKLHGGSIKREEADKDPLYKELVVPARNKIFTTLKQWLSKVSSFYLQRVQSGSGYLVGNGLTYVDLIAAENLMGFLRFIPHFADGFPGIQEHAKKVHSNPNLAKWIESRPKTEF